jgi:hypothetical protein
VSTTNESAPAKAPKTGVSVSAAVNAPGTAELDKRLEGIRDEDLARISGLPFQAGSPFRDYNPFRNSPFNNTFNNAFPNAFPNVFRNK